MTVSGKLQLLSELIICNRELYFWSYNHDFMLIHTNFPSETHLEEMLSLLDVRTTLSKYTLFTNKPSIIETALGMIWIVSVEQIEEKQLKYHLIGPAMYGNTSYMNLNKKMDQLNLSIQEKSKFFRKLQEIPIVPTNILYNYALMLHYCINGNRITEFDIYYPQSSERAISKDVSSISTDHHGVWIAEQNLMKMIREGNSNYKQALETSSGLSTGIKFDVGDSLRQKKSSSVVLLTLCSRAAIEGGLSPAVSFNLCDYYTQKIEECSSLSSLTQICSVLLDDFVEKVSENNALNSLSKDIQFICNYIQIHISEKLSISDLAKQIHYTDYYFSKKFKKEIGQSVTDYINAYKIEKARLLLRSSVLSVNDISDELSFISRSHFSTLFKRIVGCSPLKYRELNQNL